MLCVMAVQSPCLTRELLQQFVKRQAPIVSRQWLTVTLEHVNCTLNHGTRRMLLTVYADRLLVSEHARTSHVSPEHAALAFQFLDYPLLVLRARGEYAQGTLDFKRGKAACVEADGSELGFLLEHVTTSVLLLDTSHQPRPKLLATGQVTLQPRHQQPNSFSSAVRRQNVVLCDAAQQPIACAEVYASLQDENSLSPGAQQSAVAANAAVNSLQVPNSHVQACSSGHRRSSNTADSSEHLQNPTNLLNWQLSHSDLQLPQHRDSKIKYTSTTGLSQSPGMQPIQDTCLTHCQGMQHWTPSWSQQLQHIVNHNNLPVVLQHQQLTTADPPQIDTSSSSLQLTAARSNNDSSKQKAQHRKAQVNSKSTNKPRAQSASAKTVRAAALKATSILQSGTQAAPASAARLSKQGTGSKYKDPDVWSPPPPKPQRRFFETPTKNSRRDTVVKHSPNKTAMQQQHQHHQQQQRLQGLKEQQLKHWHSNLQHQQQQDDWQIQAIRSQGVAEDSESDDCLEVDDISCSLSMALLQDEQNSGDKQIIRPAAAGIVDEAAGQPEDKQTQVLVQPAMPANLLHNRQCDKQQASTEAAQQSRQQQQQHLCSCCRELHATSATILQHNSCHNCAVTISAAAQLLQATQQSAANVHTNPSAPMVSQYTGAAGTRPPPQQQQQQLFQGGVSAATSVVWELMTLMSVRAVMSQAVNTMAGQLSSTVGQMLQQAMGNICHGVGVTAAVPGAMVAMPVPAAAVTGQASVQQQAAVQDKTSAADHGGNPNTEKVACAATPQQQSAAGAGDQQGLTQQQLKQQQEELQKQFEQLEALMVVRDDSSSTSSGHSSSRSSQDSSNESYRRRLRHHSSRSSRQSSLRHSSSSPKSLEYYRDTKGLSGTEEAAAAGASSSVTNGLIFRLKRSSAADRREQSGNTLSRMSSIAAAKSTTSAGHSPGSDIKSPAAATPTTEAHSNGDSHKQPATDLASASAANKGWLTIHDSNPAGPAAKTSAVAAAATSTNTAVVPRPSVPFSLPPLSPPRSTDGGGGASNRLSAAGSGSLISRRKLSVASVDTSYSETYDEDFESASSSRVASPKASSSGSPLAGAAGHGSSSRLDSSSIAARSPSSPGQHAAISPTSRAAGGVGSSSTARQRSSSKLERRGSELPEIPEIPEDMDSFEAELAALGLSNLSSLPTTQQQQQQRQGVTRGSGASSTAADALDSLTASILEELLPPGSSSISRRNSSSINAALLSGSQQDMMVAAAAGGSTGAEARTMAAVLPNSTRRAVVRPMTVTTAAAAAAGSSAVRSGATQNSNTDPINDTQSEAVDSSTSQQYSYNPPQQQQQRQQQVQQLDAVSSFVSVNSSLDDLLGSSDLTMYQPSNKTSGDILMAAGTAGKVTSMPVHVSANTVWGDAITNKSKQQQQQQQQQRRPMPVSPGSSASAEPLTSFAQRPHQYSQAAPRESNYSDVSFLSDEEDESAQAAAAAAARHQQGMAAASARRTESGISYMSSLGDSHPDIEYSEEMPAAMQYQPSRPDVKSSAAAAAAPSGGKQRMPERSSVGSSTRPRQPGQRAFTADAGQQHSSASLAVPHVHNAAGLRPQSVPAAGSSGTGRQAVTSGSQGSSAVRNAADVFYSHVSGTPAWSPAQQYGRAGDGGRGW